MRFPLTVSTVVALAGSALLAHYYGDHHAQPSPPSRAGFLRTFTALWFAQLVLWLIYAVAVYPRFVSPLRHLPTPPGAHWLFGHGLSIMTEKPGGPMREWVQTIPNDGVIRYFWFFGLERLLVCSNKALAEVLVTNNYVFRKPENVRSALGRVLGYGVLLAEGDEHKRQRRNLMPAFAFRHIKNLYPVFWDKAREAVEAMTAACGAEGAEGAEGTGGAAAAEMEIGEWASRCSLDIIGVAGLGRDFHAIRDENNELVRTYRVLFSPPARLEKVMLPLGILVPTWLLQKLPIKRNRDLARAAAAIRGVCHELIREKKAKLLQAAGGEEQLPDVDILSVALGSGQFSDEDLADQLMTFLAAGHETTAAALTWAVYALCRFPDVQARLRAEVREKLPRPTTTSTATAAMAEGVTSAHVDQMPYLNAVCSEVLRLYSPVPVTIREAAHDTAIVGHAVPRGTRVMLVPWAVNVDPKLWGADAGEFKPERWIPPAAAAAVPAPAPVRSSEEGSSKKTTTATTTTTTTPAALGGASSNYAFMTFLHGPRGCIGQSFARAELACLLAAWVGRFEFELVDKAEMDEKNMEIKGGVTAKPAKGLRVRTRVVGGY